MACPPAECERLNEGNPQSPNLTQAGANRTGRRLGEAHRNLWSLVRYLLVAGWLIVVAGIHSSLRKSWAGSMPITMLAVRFWEFCAPTSRAGTAGYVLGLDGRGVRSVEVVPEGLGSGRVAQF